MPLNFKNEIMPYLNDVHEHHYDENYKPKLKINAVELLNFVKGFHCRLTSNAPFPIAIENANRNILDRYAYNLVLFRACMADKNLYQKDGRSYVELLSSRNLQAQNTHGQMYLRNLFSGNPFLIKLHVSELFKILRDSHEAGTSKEILEMLSKEIEVNLMEGIERLDPQYYRGIALMLTGHREMLLDKLMMSYFPEHKRDFEAHQLFCSNANALLTAASDVSGDASLQIYHDSELIRDFALGASIDDSLNQVRQMEACGTVQTHESDFCIQSRHK